MTGGLMIGQAAAFAGVTIKTVRHYHRLGLLDEPDRDTSGYRRYTSTDLLRLVQVRTLAEAGVPLTEIADLLDADPEHFAATVADVERRLTERITGLIARRDTLRRLADGDRALLPDRACVLLDRLAELGFGPAVVDSQREALVLAHALAPALFDGFLAQLERRLDDADYVKLWKRTWDALSWEPDDPRLDDLASEVADNLLTERAAMQTHAGTLFSSSDAATRYHLINDHRADEAPTATRLTALIEARLRAAGIQIPQQ
ncbi:MerR family transcriptional regulator [Actinoplanes siamensis]|uniref:MerR family transcriptional regulator n=1 Tax=Actinoplanes siamensis TaxID=1223317 RepID=A0A919N545_9ACTN|nr:MerR family transcriptional regulator [Actinoplanes siamensis]GIF04594.1 MerR family transcriptional regulator [Actinoplanes siamensis]